MVNKTERQRLAFEMHQASQCDALTVFKCAAGLMILTSLLLFGAPAEPRDFPAVYRSVPPAPYLSPNGDDLVDAATRLASSADIGQQ
jgi:hypothetical protein